MRLIASGTHSTVYLVDGTCNLPLSAPRPPSSSLPPAQSNVSIKRSIQDEFDDVGCVCVKRVYRDQAVFPPHSVFVEVDVLRRARHPNIISLVDSHLNPQTQSYDLYLPYIPQTLRDLLLDPHFAPIPFEYTLTSNANLHPHPDSEAVGQDRRSSSFMTRAKQQGWYTTLTRSMIVQLIDALRYLHEELRVAHRDLKPANVLVKFRREVQGGLLQCLNQEGHPTGEVPEESERGRHVGNPDALSPSNGKDDVQDVQVKLIDFGTALDMNLPDPPPVALGGYSVDGHPEGDGWEEEPGYRGRRVLQVGSGPHRAPELLLSSSNPDPFAMDAWALGCIVAEMFRGMEWVVRGDGSASHFKTQRRKRRRMRAFNVRVVGDSDGSGGSDESDPSESSEEEEALNLVLPTFTRRARPPPSRTLDLNLNLKTQPPPRLGQPPGQWTRPPLFDTPRGGEIATLGAIFRVLGRPRRAVSQGEEGEDADWTWFWRLPDSNKVSFASSCCSSSSSGLGSGYGSGSEAGGSPVVEETDEYGDEHDEGFENQPDGDHAEKVEWDDFLPFLRHYGRGSEDDRPEPSSSPTSTFNRFGHGPDSTHLKPPPPSAEPHQPNPDRPRTNRANEEKDRLKRLLCGLLSLDPEKRLRMDEAGRMFGFRLDAAT